MSNGGPSGGGIGNTAPNWFDQYSPLTSFFGSKPQVIPWNVMGLPPEQIGALTEDVQAFPEIQALGNLYQTYMLSGLNAAIPGFSDLLAQGGKDTMTMLTQAEPLLEGKIPQDVADQVYRSSAFQSLLSGGAGSPMASANTARNLGLTSLNLINQGANLAGAGGNAAQQWYNIARSTMLDPTYGLISPMERAQWDLQQQLLKHNTEQAAANVAAAPNPTASGLLQLALTAYGGGMLGGGGGSPSGGSFAGAPGSSAGAMDYYNPNYQYGAGIPSQGGGGGGGFGGFGGMGGGGFGGGGGGTSAGGGTGFYKAPPTVGPLSVSGSFGGGGTSEAGFPFLPSMGGSTVLPGVSGYGDAFGGSGFYPGGGGIDVASAMANAYNFPSTGGMYG